ncbi:Inner membrane transport protein ynfM [Providencia rustigianii]|uniref:Inner membrane transport protein ynfM n=4 Tax=Providencia rustigianii TaxID=158850 RepID=A0A379G3R2_9GAMM|nr:MFS transporter [Providencia rustigianii]MTC59040.1 MFS transporter [Providencia rustigianii]SPY77621.1 Inner membrane transport protein ynfM [Providencia rustigianii]SUC35608.1 Inner membrane transport protein ynfM [Providencia rustigianii]VEB69955.1 Inner membrane transport protein ynfM [Providencia rustigianii]
MEPSSNRLSTNTIMEDKTTKTLISSDPKKHYIQRDDALYLRVTLSFFTVGFATFALLYFVQPILPMLSADFNVSPATASLSLSLSTGLMALGLLVTGPISDAIGRKNVMVISLTCAAIFTLMSSVMQSWQGILIARALVGLSLSGVAAVAMTYLSEEIHPSYVALSMGLYISGNSIGGMSGRLMTGVVADYYSWRVAVVILGTLALIAAIGFWRLLPPSQHFRATSLKPRNLWVNLHLHLRDKGLPWLFIEGFVLMGAFVTMYNYIGYRLLEPPYNFSQSVVGFLSIIYLTGTYSATKTGSLTQKYGYGRVLIAAIGMMLIGVVLTLHPNIWIILTGMTVLTAGFFAGHSVASSWVGRRAKRARGQASSLYLFSYYAGSSIAGTLGGVFWSFYGWNGVALFISVILLLGVAIGYKLKNKC